MIITIIKENLDIQISAYEHHFIKYLLVKLPVPRPGDEHLFGANISL